MHYFDWLYVGALAADDDFGISGMAQFLVEIKDFGHCVAFEELIPKVKDVNHIKWLGKLLVKEKQTSAGYI